MATYRHSHYFLIGLVATIIIASMVYSFYASNRMINKYSLLVDAAMEVKLEATSAHLWLEEIISSDRYENMRNCSRFISKSDRILEQLAEIEASQFTRASRIKLITEHLP